MAAGRIVGETGGCRILLRIANPNWTVYGITVITALFWAVSLPILINGAVAGADGRALASVALWFFAIVGILFPAAFITLLGYSRTTSDKGAAFALQFLEDLFGTRPTPS